MALSRQHQNFLLLDQGAIPIVFNFFLNGFFVWAALRAVDAIPLWGKTSVGVDLLLTGFLLRFFTGVAVGPNIVRAMKKGKLAPLRPEQVPQSSWFQWSPLMRAIVGGVIGVVFCSLPMVIALSLAHAQPIASLAFIVFKAVWAALLAAVFTPVLGWSALVYASVRSA